MCDESCGRYGEKGETGQAALRLNRILQGYPFLREKGGRAASKVGRGELFPERVVFSPYGREKRRLRFFRGKPIPDGRGGLAGGRTGFRTGGKACLFVSDGEAHERHVAEGAARYGQGHVLFPHLKGDGEGGGQRFRKAGTAFDERAAFETVHHEHPPDGRGKHRAEVGHEVRRFFAEKQKGRPARDLRGQGGKAYHDGCLKGGHDRSPAEEESFLRKRSRSTMMMAMEGRRKYSGPKTSRQRKVTESPMREEA